MEDKKIVEMETQSDDAENVEGEVIEKENLISKAKDYIARNKKSLLKKTLSVTAICVTGLIGYALGSSNSEDDHAYDDNVVDSEATVCEDNESGTEE